MEKAVDLLFLRREDQQEAAPTGRSAQENRKARGTIGRTRGPRL